MAPHAILLCEPYRRVELVQVPRVEHRHPFHDERSLQEHFKRQVAECRGRNAGDDIVFGREEGPCACIVDPRSITPRPRVLGVLIELYLLDRLFRHEIAVTSTQYFFPNKSSTS